VKIEEQLAMFGLYSKKELNKLFANLLKKNPLEQKMNLSVRLN